MRDSLKRARKEDAQLRAYTRSNGFQAKQQSLDELRRPAEEAPDFQWFGAALGRGNARWHFWQSEAARDARTFNEGQLLVAATPIAAEFEVSRSLHFRGANGG